MLNNRSILITGGTGSFGKKFVEIILSRYPDVNRLVIYSRDAGEKYKDGNNRKIKTTIKV